MHHRCLTPVVHFVYSLKPIVSLPPVVLPLKLKYIGRNAASTRSTRHLTVVLLIETTPFLLCRPGRRVIRTFLLLLPLTAPVVKCGLMRR